MWEQICTDSLPSSTNCSFLFLRTTGVYGYPLEDATAIAVKTVAQWLEDHADYAMQVIFCCFDARTAQAYQTKME